MPETSDELRNRPEYRSAEEYLNSIEEYLRSLESNSQFEISVNAKQARHLLRATRDVMTVNAQIVTAAHRETNPQYGREWCDEGVSVDFAHPGLLVQTVVVFSDLISYLRLQTVVSCDQERAGYGLIGGLGGKGLWNRLRGPVGPPFSRIKRMLSMGVGFSGAQSKKGKYRAAQRRAEKKACRTVAEITCDEAIHMLARRRDVLGDYEKPSELWDRLQGLLDEAGVPLVEHGNGVDKYYTCSDFSNPLTYEYFRKQIRRARMQ